MQVSSEKTRGTFEISSAFSLLNSFKIILSSTLSIPCCAPAFKLLCVDHGGIEEAQEWIEKQYYAEVGKELQEELFLEVGTRRERHDCRLQRGEKRGQPFNVTVT